ncbi:MAG: hypothetical protein KIT31_24650 [Deltaproteobacteria bacterium]|nr:hypothetical protein [Deltaproteobacteria bacterium]
MRRIAALLVLLVAACGDDGVNNLPDAPLNPDGPPLPTAPVKLTVTLAGDPAKDVKVFFQNADSSVVATRTTDAAGVASAVMAPGGFVTAIDPGLPPDLGGGFTFTSLSSWAGVQPGDDLHLDIGGGRPNTTSVTFDVVVPADPNAVVYSLFTSCGSADITPFVPVPLKPFAGLIAVANPPVRVSLFGCAQNLADMAVMTFDENFTPVSSFYKTNVALADEATVELDGTYAPIGGTAVTVSNVPAALPNLGFDHTLRSPRGFLFSAFQQIPPVTGTATGTITVPGTIGTTSTMTVFGFAQPGAFSEQTILDWGPYSATYALDWGSTALKDYTSEPSFDPATHAISWTLGATGGTGDVILALYSSSRTVGGNFHSWGWRIAAPAGASVAYPVLPPGQPFDFNTAASDTYGVSRVTTAKVPGGYAAIRPHAHVLEDTFVLGPSGRAVVVDMFHAGK